MDIHCDWSATLIFIFLFYFTIYGFNWIELLYNVQMYHRFLIQGEKDCSYYAKYGQCKFGITCKFNHPHSSGLRMSVPARGPGSLPTPVTVPTPVVYPTPSVQSSQQYGIFPGNWPVARPAVFPPSYVSGTYGHMLLPPAVVPGPGWTPYSVGVAEFVCFMWSFLECPSDYKLWYRLQFVLWPPHTLNSPLGRAQFMG